MCITWCWFSISIFTIPSIFSCRLIIRKSSCYQFTYSTQSWSVLSNSWCRIIGVISCISVKVSTWRCLIFYFTWRITWLSVFPIFPFWSSRITFFICRLYLAISTSYLCSWTWYISFTILTFPYICSRSSWISKFYYTSFFT